jgi:hypothetical protein
MQRADWTSGTGGTDARCGDGSAATPQKVGGQALGDVDGHVAEGQSWSVTRPARRVSGRIVGKTYLWTVEATPCFVGDSVDGGWGARSSACVGPMVG